MGPAFRTFLRPAISIPPSCATIAPALPPTSSLPLDQPLPSRLIHWQSAPHSRRILAHRLLQRQYPLRPQHLRPIKALVWVGAPQPSRHLTLSCCQRRRAAIEHHLPLSLRLVFFRMSPPGRAEDHLQDPALSPARTRPSVYPTLRHHTTRQQQLPLLRPNSHVRLRDHHHLRLRSPHQNSDSTLDAAATANPLQAHASYSVS